MSRKRYLMLSKQHYMDMDSFKVLTKSERSNPNNTFIPKFLWTNDINPKLAVGFEMRNGQLVDIINNNLETNVIDLYGIRITFYSEFDADISFYDNRSKQRHKLAIRGAANYFTRPINKKRVDQLISHVIFNMTFDDITNTFMSDLSKRELFKPIGYLGQCRMDEDTSKSNSLFLNYGMLYNDFKIEYLGKELNGSCYVFMFGLWAILLQDNLSFDALVTIKGCNRDRIIVDKFIYTSNIYLIKIISL